MKNFQWGSSSFKVCNYFLRTSKTVAYCDITYRSLHVILFSRTIDRISSSLSESSDSGRDKHTFFVLLSESEMVRGEAVELGGAWSNESKFYETGHKELDRSRVAEAAYREVNIYMNIKLNFYSSDGLELKQLTASKSGCM